ncbi:hypothetical protein GCM10027347_55510 [Larkinella harenae]
MNDTIWYGTGQVLRIKEADQQLADVRQFNLIVNTDIDYPGMGGGPNTDNGCLDPKCDRTQILMLYNIPLKKGRTSIAKLNKHGKLRKEEAQLSYVSNSGGLTKRYTYQGQKPSWVRVTKVDKASGTVEGCFAILFKEDMSVYNRLQNGMPETARFTEGLFRIKITDVTLK